MVDWDAIDNYTDYEAQEALWGVASLVEEVLDRIRLGVYDEQRHGSLRDVLEELERRLR